MYILLSCRLRIHEKDWFGIESVETDGVRPVAHASVIHRIHRGRFSRAAQHFAALIQVNVWFPYTSFRYDNDSPLPVKSLQFVSFSARLYLRP